MLHPADEAFLTHAVRSGRLREDQARELWDRYQGQPGGLPDALVLSGLLTTAQRDQIADELRSGSRRYPPRPSSRIPATVDPAPTRPDRTTPADPIPATRPDVETGTGTGTETGTGTGSGSVPPAVSRPSARLRSAGIPGYTVERELGRGGMGAVYLGTQDATGRKVAIKILLNAGERQTRRFEREVHAMARLRHPHIVELLDSGSTPRGPFLVMAYHEGGDLDEALQEERIDREAVLRLTADAAQALAYAHAQGILHRDLKPANILIGTDGQVRVTDFGLAKIVDRETRLTRTNAAVGTPHYMAPEQVRGDAFTPAVDSYGLGVVLYQALTGQVPFDSGDRIELYASILKAPPQPPWELADVPPDLGRLVLWALEKDPDDRPTCAQIAAAIEKHLAGDEAAALPPSLQRRRRQLTFVGMAAALGVAVAAVLVAIGTWTSDAQTDAQVEQAHAQLDEAIAAARRARSGRDLPALLTELEAHAAVEAALIEVPYAALPAALERVERSRQRHAEAIGQALPLLLEAGRLDEAAELARQRARIDRTPAAKIALASVLALQRTTAPEAYELAEAAAAEVESPAARADLARAYLRLHRPAQAAASLEGASPELLGLRARAREAAGDLSGAVADARAASRAAPDDLALSVLRIALVARAGGDARAALRLLEATRAGSLTEFHLTRAELHERLGNYAACKAAYADALKLDAASAPALARMHLRRGHGLSALEVLEDERSPRARLDLAVAQWIGGADDAATVDALAGVLHDVSAYTAPPSLAAAAMRWTARRIEVCQGQLEQAEASAQRAWELQPDARSAACLGFVRWRRGDAAGARDALAAIQARTVEGRALEARLDLEAGAQRKASQRAELLPKGSAARLTLQAQLLAGDPRQAEVSQRLYFATHTGQPGRPAALPVASAEGPEPRALAARSLLHAARALSSAERDRGQVLLRRAQALLPGGVGARLALASLNKDLDLVGAVIARHPGLPVARRTRIAIHSRLARAEREASSPRVLLDDMQTLADADELSPGERAAFARVLHEQDLERAWRVLEPALSMETRDYNAFRLGAELARARGDAARARELAEARDEIRASLRDRQQLLSAAFYSEDHSKLPGALAALRRLARDTPRTAKYWLLRAQADFGQGGFDQANLSGAEFLLEIRALRADQLSMWIHALSWNRQIRQDVMREVTRARVAEDPLDPVPWLARAFFLTARYTLQTPSDPEDAERAADQVLYAIQCRPSLPGPLALGANLAVSTRESRLAQDLIHRALRLDPGCEFAVFQTARDAATRGDVQGVIDALEGISNLHKPKVSRQLTEDPVFAPLLRDEAYVEFLEQAGAR